MKQLFTTLQAFFRSNTTFTNSAVIGLKLLSEVVKRNTYKHNLYFIT